MAHKILHLCKYLLSKNVVSVFLKGLAIIFASQVNPLIIFGSKEIWSKANNNTPLKL